jgi:hypothetical protein
MKQKSKTDYVLVGNVIQIISLFFMILTLLAPHSHRAHAYLRAPQTSTEACEASFTYDCD